MTITVCDRCKQQFTHGVDSLTITTQDGTKKSPPQMYDLCPICTADARTFLKGRMTGQPV